METKQLAQPTAISHRGYATPLYVISVLNKMVVTKMNCKNVQASFNYSNLNQVSSIKLIKSVEAHTLKMVGVMYFQQMIHHCGTLFPIINSTSRTKFFTP